MTPEEIVRQSLLQELLEKGYPKELIIVERGVEEIAKIFSDNTSKSINRRVDILCCAKLGQIFPLLLIECKSIKLNQSALRQVGGYNYFIGSPLYAIANRDEIKIASIFDENLLFEIPFYIQAKKICYKDE